MSRRELKDSLSLNSPSIRETRLIGLPKRRSSIADRIRRDGRIYATELDDNGRHAHLRPIDETAFPPLVSRSRKSKAAVG